MFFNLSFILHSGLFLIMHETANLLLKLSAPFLIPLFSSPGFAELADMAIVVHAFTTGLQLVQLFCSTICI